MKEDTSRIDWKGKKYSAKELREYQQAHRAKCAACGYKFFDALRHCPLCGKEPGISRNRPLGRSARTDKLALMRQISRTLTNESRMRCPASRINKLVS